MTAVIQAQTLGKRYGHGRRWALRDCTLDIPAGHVVGLVGPNGAGKTTLLSLAVGHLLPTLGSIEVLGGRPGAGPAQMAKVGFVAQDAPTYAALSVADHLKLGARLNPGWDDALARQRIGRLGLDPARRAGKLSGGQRAQLALTLGVAKRPELLILDEPVAALDPLARREFLQGLLEATVEHELSVVLSSHLVSLPAMAITLAVFVAVQFAMPLLVRPHLLPPTRSTIQITESNLEEFQLRPDRPIRVSAKPADTGAWVLSSHTVDASGHAVDSIPPSPSLSPAAGPCQRGLSPCLAEVTRLGYRQQVTYQPSSRFWPFQWSETGIYTALALGLAGFCFWQIRRRLS